MPAPSPFVELPNGQKLQYAWDSTSLKSLMFCPRRYQYEILEGWKGSAVELQFGGFLASAWERFQKGRSIGMDRDEAMLNGLQWLLDATAAHDGQPAWGGTYETLWRCTGTTKFKNAKGNAAKCPYSHKGKWFPLPAPETCSCGSPTEQKRLYQPLDPLRHRESLLRTYVWYCDDQPEDMKEGLYPYTLPDGSAAVELSFTMPLPWSIGLVMDDDEGKRHRWTQEYQLCGHLDYLGVFGEEMFVCDNKTTKKTLGLSYWAGFQPDVQVDTYDLAASLLFPSLPIRGVLIDAAQVLQGGARFGRHVFYRSEAQREEYLSDLRFWLSKAEEYAAAGHYPMNRSVCWVCPFKAICAKEPDKRQMYLEQAFQKRQWNPLEER